MFEEQSGLSIISQHKISLQPVQVLTSETSEHNSLFENVFNKVMHAGGAILSQQQSFQQLQQQEEPSSDSQDFINLSKPVISIPIITKKTPSQPFT